MAHLIDKDALVAEIERLKTIYNDGENIHHIARYNILVDILSFIDTIEVKGVDLEKEIEEVKHNYKVDDNRHTSICSADIEWLANHFFELGLSVNNPITAAYKGTAEEIILALNTLGEEKMISYDKEIEWLNKIKEL